MLQCPAEQVLWDRPLNVALIFCQPAFVAEERGQEEKKSFYFCTPSKTKITHTEIEAFVVELWFHYL